MARLPCNITGSKAFYKRRARVVHAVEASGRSQAPSVGSPDAGDRLRLPPSRSVSQDASRQTQERSRF
ncbi:hypothetical protein WJX79_001750 [Trebouxia sp. C0005]